MVVFDTQPTSRRGDMMVQRGMGTVRRKKDVLEPPTQLAEPGLGATIEQQVRLYNDSTGVENLANDPFVVEQAKHAVISALNDTQATMEFNKSKWLTLYRLWRGETLLTYGFGQAPLHSPEPFKIVETLHPRLMREIFGSQRWYRLLGEDNTWDANAKAQERLTTEQLRADRYRRKASALIRNGLIYGNAPQKTYWKQETGHRRMRVARRVPDPKKEGATKVVLEEKKHLELLFDGNTTQLVSPFDFYAPPNASNIEDAEWAADRTAWPDFKVKQMGELGHWMHLNELVDHPGSSSATFDDEFKERKSYSYGVFDPRGAQLAPHIPHYCVIDWWGPLVIRASGRSYETRQCNVTMLEPHSKKLVVRVTENPYWHGQKPYQLWRPIAVDDELFGVGALEMVARLSFEMDAKRTLFMIASQLESNPALIVSDEANIPDGQLEVIRPGQVYRVPGDPSKAAVPLFLPKVSDSALKSENILRIDMRETSGTTSPQMGASDPFGSAKTATQYTSEVNQADVRLSELVESFDEDITTGMLLQMVWNNQQFMSWERVVREIGPDGVRYRDTFTVRPEDLLGRFIVQPLAGLKLKQRQVQVQQLVSLLDRAPIVNQMYGPQAVKMPRLIAKILEDGFDIRNVDDFIGMGTDDGSELMPAIMEHELWYHGSVPPRRNEDNDLFHIQAHYAELGQERFAKLEAQDPATAALARAHIGDHIFAVARLQEFQQKQSMLMAQQQGMAEMNPGVPGAPFPGEGGESPKVRRNENERGEGTSDGGDGEGTGVRADAGREAPNTGSQT